MYVRVQWTEFVIIRRQWDCLYHKFTQWRSQGGQPGICPLDLWQALGREYTHQDDQGENCNLQL